MNIFPKGKKSHIKNPIKYEPFFEPFLIPLITKSFPNLLANEICKVQPMTGPTGMIFAMKI